MYLIWELGKRRVKDDYRGFGLCEYIDDGAIN